LLQRNNRSYFQEPLRLDPAQIYVSPLDLGRRNGLIEEVHRPTLRIAAPISAGRRQTVRLFMINVDMRRRSTASGRQMGRGETIYVVNKQGDYLIHPIVRANSARCSASRRLEADFPHLASQAGATQGSAEIVPDQAARPGGIALAPGLWPASNGLV
jgi:hypothetical protein